MALNVKFLRGKSTALPSTPTEGYFYLTTDTNKLYAGIRDTADANVKLALLNHDITVVESAAALAPDTHNKDQLYYARQENALVIYDETKTAFVQINPDRGATSVNVVGTGDVIVDLSYDETTRVITATKGSITANKIKTTQDITVTTATGNYSKNDKITAGSDIENILLTMLCQDSNPSATQPSTSITLSNNKTTITSDTYLEAGSTFTPKFSVTNNIGKYTANGVDQASGVTVNSTTVTEYGRPGATTNATATGTSGGFDVFTVTDSTTGYYLDVSTSFSDGVVPKTFLGKENDACIEAQIKATSKGNSSKKIIGYRSVFYGYKTGSTMLDIENITSEQIRALNAARVMTTSMSTTNMQQLIFAFPSTWGVKSVTVVGEPAPRNIKKLGHTVNVFGANGHTAIPYDIFYASEGSENSGAEKFTISYSTTA